MPTYQYECDACKHTFEILQSMLDEKLKKCPQCKEKKLHRLIGSGSGIIFKGSGFYETDYKRKESPQQATTDNTQKEPAKAATAKEGVGTSSSGKKEEKETSQLVS